MTNWRYKCPICGYPFNTCQCRFTGSGHPDREIRRKVVLQHLYLLYPEQIEHLVKIQNECRMSYGTDELREELKDLERRRNEE